MADNDIITLTDNDRKEKMGDKGSGRRIFENTMNTRVTVRLDEKHIAILQKFMKENDIDEMSVAIRMIIEKTK